MRTISVFASWSVPAIRILRTSASSAPQSGAVYRCLPCSTGSARFPAGRRVRVTGFDDEQRPSVTSNPGAGWVFTREELDRTGAFLALRMNGAALTADHGAPIRLVVPNYYGCSCISGLAH